MEKLNINNNEWQRLGYKIIGGPELPLSERILNTVLFISMCIASMSLCLVIALPNNWATLLVFCGNITCFSSLYYLSRFKKAVHQAMVIYVVLALAILIFSWFLVGGIKGGSAYYFPVAIIFFIIITPSPFHKTLIISSFSVLLGLAFVEYHYPYLVDLDIEPQVLRLGHFLSSLVAIGAIAFTIFILKKAYHREQQKIIQQTEELLATNAAKSRFLANISHEIRTPMTGVMGMASLLDNTALSPEQNEYVDSIKISSNRLLLVINKILDYSKIEAGEVKLNQQTFNVETSIQNVLAAYRPKIKGKFLELHVDLPSDIPAPLIGDSTKLELVLSNLLENAIKFTDKGSISLSVTIAQQTYDSIELQFSVQDTGIGIASKHFHKLFAPFTQLDDSRTRMFMGTGLGLALCKELVTLMNGKIWVRSDRGKGSTFSFKVPLNIQHTSTQTVAPTTIQSSTKQGQTTPNILIVDDNKVNRLLIGRLIQKYGHQAEEAANGQEAIQKIIQNNYHLILMDIQMPIMNGIETTQYIRNFHQHQPTIVAMTADDSVEDKAVYQSIGMNDFLNKPIEIEELKGILTKWL